MATKTERATFGDIRSLPGCSPSTMKSLFGDLAERENSTVYETIWMYAGLKYSEHTGRKPNNYWSDEKHRHDAVRTMVSERARHLGITQQEAIRRVTHRDFRRGKLAALLNDWFGGSPERAMRSVFGVVRRSIVGEFKSWPATEQHLRNALADVDCEHVSVEEFLRVVPGGSTILEKHGGLVTVLDRSGIRPFSAFRHQAPSGYWKNKRSRIRWVRRLVEKTREERLDPNCLPNSADFRENLGGLLASTGIGHRDLLREAGFVTDDPPNWSIRDQRITRVRELVERVGGPDRITLEPFLKQASGLVDYYQRTLGKRVNRDNTSLRFHLHESIGNQLLFTFSAASPTATVEIIQRALFDPMPSISTPR